MLGFGSLVDGPGRLVLVEGVELGDGGGSVDLTGAGGCVVHEPEAEVLVGAGAGVEVAAAGESVGSRESARSGGMASVRQSTDVPGVVRESVPGVEASPEATWCPPSGRLSGHQ